MTNHITTQEAVETWKLAHRFTLDVYRLSNRLPREEHYGLIPKVRTSSVKIASNIVEGYARKSTESYLRHLTDSQVAMEETKYSLLVARDLGYISEHAYDKLMTDAEALSERLENLQQQLSVGRGAASEKLEPETGSPGLFGVSKGVRHSVADFVTWLRGGEDRIADRRRRKENRNQEEPNVWVEEDRVHNYLSQPED